MWQGSSAIDRLDDQRSRPDWLAERWTDPRAGVIEVDRRSNPATEGDRLRLVPAEGPYDEQRHWFVGVTDEGPRFARVNSGDETTDLRYTVSQLAPDEAELALTAAALANWHRGEGYCPTCGATTRITAGGHARVCAACGRQGFPRHDPAIIVAVLDAQDRLLLGHQHSWPDGRYSTLAGFVNAGESLEQAVHREVFEEAGLRVSAVRYEASQPWPFPRSLMCAFAARAADDDVRVDGVEITDARFFTRDQVRQRLESGVMSHFRVSIAASAHLIGRWLNRELVAPEDGYGG